MWFETYYKQLGVSKVGETDHPIDNPPELGEGDTFAWNFYQDYSRSFVQEYGLMSSLINELNLNPGSKRLFLLKLDMIHQTILRIREKEMIRKQEEK